MGFGACGGRIVGLGGRYSKEGRVGSGLTVGGVRVVTLTVVTARVEGRGFAVVGTVLISLGGRGLAFEGWQELGSHESLHTSTLQLVKTCELSGKLKALR